MNTMQLAQGNPRMQAAVLQARKLLHRKALTGAVSSMVPIPGLDWLVDASLMTRVIPQINEIFGLSPGQIAKLDPQKHEQLQKTITAVGATMIGRVVTKEVVLRAARLVGKRLTAQQAVKYVPVAGQMAAAALGYTALRYLGEQHIRDCIRVCQQAELELALPAPGHTLQTAPLAPASQLKLPSWLTRKNRSSDSNSEAA